MDRTRKHVAINVVAAAIFLLGCGKTRNVTHTPGTATGGDAGGSANAAGGSASGTGGSANGTGGGAGAVGGVGGSASGAGGSTTAEPFGGAATWDPQTCHVKAVPEPADATAKEQWSLARAFCRLALKPECLQAGAVSGVKGCSAELVVERCVAEVLWFHYQNVPAECEDAWRKDIQCGSQSSATSPACEDINTSGPFGSAEKCAEENAALQDCSAKHSTEVKVDGSYTTCSYSAAPGAPSNCEVTCQLDEHWAALRCSGPPGLPKQCGCTVNGHVLTSQNPIFVSDCADAAEQAADGLCTSQLDCCFEYRDGDNQACRCGYPDDFGYDSCEAMMAVADGHQVSICPDLLPDNGGGCWPPGHCVLP
jgi:hypothetical protein